ncbi:putative PurR-regulated permease PerM [Dysgonomonas sp. PFB1-18]|uniref:AI-2E family transporter n=1 Tax=unclassified Dysgonomonas TaxID=2630389 RepID=UPI0024740BDC|nr:MULTISPECIES: AI-2E family transporter [unclassified Dysgonomonas]MDH6307267.1 putative PurR-regulated permease PerM [Dysgonomonas sp. PF1-14]MDH6337185.1 putative PurR-regulated permease PerM [Dysgonomonas sp. PF1-16]MDH6379109.1 putative PurR-regulated permease PerM [Dysgonomonas sp. PFB1-18]MDH6396254.1 putative PurR-regulated permease PerM [Dysgonomonas sp. PF1-23]
MPLGQPFEKPFTFDRTIRMLISVLAIGAGLYFLYILKDVLLPFFIAWLLAYMLNPLVRFYQKRLRLVHSLAVVLTLLSVAGVLTLLGFILVPLIENEIWQINALVASYDLTSISKDGIPVSVADAIGRYIDFKEIQESLSKDNLVEIFQFLGPAVEALFSNTVTFLLGLTVVFIVLLYLIFILLDYDKINELWRFLIPPKYRPIVGRITLDVETSMNKYFRHQAFICIILAILYATGFYIIGLPLAIMFGIIVGLVHMIPYLQVITFPPAILLCWLRASQTADSFWVMIGLVALIYVIVQCIMDLFLVPRIMGKAMGLNPAIILLSLSVWGSLLGVVGMIIAIPLTTLILSYYKEFIAAAERMQAIENAQQNIPFDEEE